MLYKSIFDYKQTFISSESEPNGEVKLEDDDLLCDVKRELDDQEDSDFSSFLNPPSSNSEREKWLSNFLLQRQKALEGFEENWTRVISDHLGGKRSTPKNDIEKKEVPRMKKQEALDNLQEQWEIIISDRLMGNNNYTKVEATEIESPITKFVKSSPKKHKEPICKFVKDVSRKTKTKEFERLRNDEKARNKGKTQDLTRYQWKIDKLLSGKGDSIFNEDSDGKSSDNDGKMYQQESTVEKVSFELENPRSKGHNLGSNIPSRKRYKDNSYVKRLSNLDQFLDSVDDEIKDESIDSDVTDQSPFSLTLESNQTKQKVMNWIQDDDGNWMNKEDSRPKSKPVDEIQRRLNRHEKSQLRYRKKVPPKNENTIKREMVQKIIDEKFAQPTQSNVLFPKTDSRIANAEAFPELKCTKCNWTPKFRSALKVHMKAVHDQVRDVQCKQCDFATYSKANLNKHVRDVHLLLKDHKCEFCPESFNRNYKLIAHLVSKHDNETHKKHVCDQCGYRSIRKVSIRNHIKSVHEKVRDQTCDQCSFTTTRRQQLIRHIRSVHVNARDHKCKQCNFTANQAGNVYRHVKLVHNKIKDVLCDECDYRTVDKTKLSTHKIRYHNNVLRRNYEFKEELTADRAETSIKNSTEDG